ncbi:GntR family transcriptional regulator [Clostridium sp. D2Q-14]|uniref:GntR family transcriptional regulator n=1 Tax=Anaeromonas gelatinilytica TaxID=2683194 RepID=UPI00193AFE87|nr:GntR family transcriptional regulator [Anaeromonas gelatinilytica]MBS4535007.1 GntR family transcriptional regulator [Anaeromonas gelatinilytica]
MTAYLSLKDHVYNFIQEKINDGTLKANAKINEQMIRKELQISRTPVREALIQLATEGYIENLPRRGFIVKPIDEKKAKELYTLIGTLDGLAASLAIDYITDEDIENMKEKIKMLYDYIENKNYKLYNKTQSEFHDIYIYISNNEELIRVINQLRRNFLKHSYSEEDETSMSKILKSTNKEHEMIVELFKKGNKEELENYIKNTHWNASHARLEKL